MEASAAEAEAISAALQRARQSNGKLDQNDQLGSEATQVTSTDLSKVNTTSMDMPMDIHIHHRSVS